MSTLKSFLQTREEETKKVIISDRFTDEKGNPAPFVVRSISQAENEALSKASTKREKVNGQLVENLNTVEYTRRLIVACTVEPNFKDTQMCQFYGVINPLDVPGKMLNIGEYKALSKAIMEINRLDLDAQEVLEEAKNS